MCGLMREKSFYMTAAGSAGPIFPEILILMKTQSTKVSKQKAAFDRLERLGY